MTNPTEAAMMRPGGLAKELRRLRKKTDFTGIALAAHLGWQQSRISRIETGKAVPTEDEIKAYLEAVKASDALPALLEMRSQVNAISREWRQGDGEVIQDGYDAMVRRASVIRNAEVTTIPGLLQTREYARYQALQAVKLHGFDPDKVDTVLDAKERRQEVLHDLGKRFEFVITEAALRLLYCPRDVMAAQLGRLLELTFEKPNIWFGVVPFDVELPVVPQNRFIMVDDVVLVEHHAGDETYRAERAATYAVTMDLLKQEAATGEAARRLIATAMSALSR